MLIRMRGACVILGCCLFAWSCQKGGPTPPEEKTAAQLTVEGWNDYKALDYQGASSLFSEAIGLDSSYVDAYNGSGWALAKLNMLSPSLEYFDMGLLRDSANLEIQGGMAFVCNAEKEYATSAGLALGIIAADSLWVFSRDSTIGVTDLRLLLAEDYFALAEYSLSLQQVLVLDPAFSASLDVSTVAGQTALAQEIERLRAII